MKSVTDNSHRAVDLIGNPLGGDEVYESFSRLPQGPAAALTLIEIAIFITLGEGAT